MAKFEFHAEGIDAEIRALELLRGTARPIMKRAVYEGAKKVGEEMIKAIDNLPVSKELYIYGDLPIYGVTQRQKDGLREGFGFAKMQSDNGFINTKSGFDGYNGVRTKRYPNGQPNAMIANAVNSGTSRRPKTGFITKALKASKQKAISAMAEQWDIDIKNTLKE